MVINENGWVTNGNGDVIFDTPSGNNFTTVRLPMMHNLKNRMFKIIDETIFLINIGEYCQIMGIAKSKTLPSIVKKECCLKICAFYNSNAKQRNEP